MFKTIFFSAGLIAFSNAYAEDFGTFKITGGLTIEVSDKQTGNVTVIDESNQEMMIPVGTVCPFPDHCTNIGHSSLIHSFDEESFMAVVWITKNSSEDKPTYQFQIATEPVSTMQSIGSFQFSSSSDEVKYLHNLGTWADEYDQPVYKNKYLVDFNVKKIEFIPPAN